MKDELAIGIVGAGGFAAFAANAFLKVRGIKVIGVTDIQETSATYLSKALNAVMYSNFEMLLQDSRIDLVYIATPPFLHYSQTKQALLSGKHVICEKPAALSTIEAEELAALATSHQLLYTVNLMQRYNPLFNIVKAIIEEDIFGDFLHGFFENYASDEKLTPEHWFWDEKKSGGIFIEHGVHFFDLFEGWLGKGKVIHAAQWQRPTVTTRLIDRVQATVIFPKGPVNFYHGFDQPKVLDRQDMRLQFERGDITLYEWVPVRIKIHGLLKASQLQRIESLLGDCSIIQHETVPSTSQKVRGRFKDITFDHLLTLEHGNNVEKQDRYEELLIAMIQDQWKWIQDRTHIRIINDRNAVESLRMAERATEMATHEKT